MNYQYIKGYQADGTLMKSYFDFTESVFRFSLADWKNAGKWDDKYVPHSLVHNDRVIANASASIMQLQIRGKDVPAIQLGSVGVLPEYRGQGLSRIIMEKVLEEYQHIPVIFLFANHKVLDFYPKFGFRRVNEGIPQINVSRTSVPMGQVDKIDIKSECLKRLLNAKLQYSSIVDARGNIPIYWYHLMYNYGDNLYYIKDKDIAFIANYRGDRATIVDVLSANPVSFEEIAGYVLKPDTKQVHFHFTPDWLLENYEPTSNEGEVLFVFGEFPENVDFKFPVTAHT